MKILLAIDGSKYSDATVQALTSQIRREDTQLLVLRIVEPRIYSTPPQMAVGYQPEMAEIMKEQFQQAQESVDRAAATLRSAGFEVSTRVLEAEPRMGILDLAAEWHADLIAMGSHGRRGLQRFMLGSVAESVARSAHCSVLIVRTPQK